MVAPAGSYAVALLARARPSPIQPETRRPVLPPVPRVPAHRAGRTACYRRGHRLGNRSASRRSRASSRRSTSPPGPSRERMVPPSRCGPSPRCWRGPEPETWSSWLGRTCRASSGCVSTPSSTSAAHLESALPGLRVGDRFLTSGSGFAGTARRYSDTLLAMLLRATQAERYRERIEVGSEPGRSVQIALTSADVEARGG